MPFVARRTSYSVAQAPRSVHRSGSARCLCMPGSRTMYRTISALPSAAKLGAVPSASCGSRIEVVPCPFSVVTCALTRRSRPLGSLAGLRQAALAFAPYLCVSLTMDRYIFWGVLVLSLVLIVGGIYSLVRGNRWTIWDTGIVVAPIPVWFTLAVLNFRVKSLSNLIEPIALILIIAFIILVRVFSKGGIPKGSWSFGGAILAAVLMYILVPPLPE